MDLSPVYPITFLAILQYGPIGGENLTIVSQIMQMLSQLMSL